MEGNSFRYPYTIRVNGGSTHPDTSDSSGDERLYSKQNQEDFSRHYKMKMKIRRSRDRRLHSACYVAGCICCSKSQHNKVMYKCRLKPCLCRVQRRCDCDDVCKSTDTDEEDSGEEENESSSAIHITSHGMITPDGQQVKVYHEVFNQHFMMMDKVLREGKFARYEELLSPEEAAAFPSKNQLYGFPSSLSQQGNLDELPEGMRCRQLQSWSSTVHYIKNVVETSVLQDLSVSTFNYCQMEVYASDDFYRPTASYSTSSLDPITPLIIVVLGGPRVFSFNPIDSASKHDDTSNWSVVVHGGSTLVLPIGINNLFFHTLLPPILPESSSDIPSLVMCFKRAITQPTSRSSTDD